MSIEGTNDQVDQHIAESTKLEPDPYVELFQLTLNPPNEAQIIINMSAKQELVWQGITFESYPVNLTGYKQDSAGENSRPSFTVANPKGIFSGYVHQRYTDNAIVTRFRVLKDHITNNVNSYVRHTWRISKCVSLTSKFAVFELRGSMDGQFFIIPARAFYPPEFPAVSL